MARRHLERIWRCSTASTRTSTTTSPGQNGFLGTGTAHVRVPALGSADITVEIHSDATDIHISSTDTHDIDLGLFARLGGIAQIAGCARIEGPPLTRITLYGMLEESAAAGSIFGPKAGYETEINITVTPTTLRLLRLGRHAAVGRASSTSRPPRPRTCCFDFAAGFAEGELYGRIDCDAVVAGLSGEGQLTWHVGPTMQYLQGRIKVGVSDWSASGGLEGGFFIGNNVPKAAGLGPRPDRHALRHVPRHPARDPHRRVRLRPGVVRRSTCYVLGGGVDIFAGAGAFASAPVGPPAPFAGPPTLPFVVGACGIYVHGEILGGLVSASAWANLSLRGPAPELLRGHLRAARAASLGCSARRSSVTAGINDTGFYIHT